MSPRNRSMSKLCEAPKDPGVAEVCRGSGTAVAVAAVVVAIAVAVVVIVVGPGTMVGPGVTIKGAGEEDSELLVLLLSSFRLQDRHDGVLQRTPLSLVRARSEH